MTIGTLAVFMDYLGRRWDRDDPPHPAAADSSGRFRHQCALEALDQAG